MKLISLTNKIDYIVVDDEDFDRISEFNWIANGEKSSISRREQVVTKVGKDLVKTKTIVIQIANEIMRKHGCIFDHIDRDCKNNQKYNLREATYNQNQFNKGKQEGNYSSKYKGVHFHARRKEYRGTVRAFNRYHYSKGFKTEIEAARWYNETASKLHGEFAVLNAIEQNVTTN